MRIFRFKDILSFDSPVHALSKTVEDMDHILDQLSVEPLNAVGVSFMDVKGETKVNKICYYLKPCRVKLWVKLFFLSNKEIILQYPFLKGKLFDWVIKKRLLKRNKICLLVHDIDSLRDIQTGSGCNSEKMQDEIHLLNSADKIVVHNDAMHKKLIECGLNTKNVIAIEIFDYLLPEAAQYLDITRQYSRNIAFAGNLEKSTFLFDLVNLKNQNFSLQLYGPYYSREKLGCNFIHYHGNLDPIELVFNLDASFGLVWDGTFINTCDGGYGEYTRYNNPFKFSMYVAARMPVICWRNSAIAHFVLEHNIGFVVDSLEDIAAVLDKITPEIYDGYMTNLSEISVKVRTGHYMIRALETLYNKI